MAPHRPGSSSGGSHPAGVSSGGAKANGLYQSGSAAMAAAKKPNLQLIQADHELFLQAFESESLLATSCTIASEFCWWGGKNWASFDRMDFKQKYIARS